MSNYTITEEQIKDIALGGGKSKIKEMFPQVFETKLKDNTWYIYPDRAIQFNKKDGVGYGINTSGFWVDGANWLTNKDNGEYIKATNEEVEAALIAEAKKRGFANARTKFKDLCTGEIVSIEGNFIYTHDNNRFVKHQSMTFYKDGIWASIIKEKSLSKSEAEAKLTELINDGNNYKIN